MYQYRSEANRFDRDFAFEITKKSEHSFFLKTKGKKRKCSITNYRSFAITNTEPPPSDQNYENLGHLMKPRKQELLCLYFIEFFNKNRTNYLIPHNFDPRTLILSFIK
jgi:hypothetical protein